MSVCVFLYQNIDFRSKVRTFLGNFSSKACLRFDWVQVRVRVRLGIGVVGTKV